MLVDLSAHLVHVTNRLFEPVTNGVVAIPGRPNAVN